MNQLLDKIAEIKQLAFFIGTDKIVNICEQIERDYKIEKRLKECKESANWVVVPQNTCPDDGLFVCHKHISLTDNIEEVLKYEGEIICEYGKVK